MGMGLDLPYLSNFVQFVNFHVLSLPQPALPVEHIIQFAATSILWRKVSCDMFTDCHLLFEDLFSLLLKLVPLPTLRFPSYSPSLFEVYPPSSSSPVLVFSRHLASS